MNNRSCPFCAPQQPRVLFSDEVAFAYRDGHPVSPGHTLIIPRRHVGSWFELTLDERDAMLRLLDAARDAVVAEFHPDGFNLGINDGPAAGQTVAHVHLHVIPRYQGDTADPRGGVRWVLPEKANYWSRPR
jgi:diadenosine tetraphosphate (Ap4A) HIT family hydrolase